MEKNENPLNENIFISIVNCHIKELEDHLNGDIIIYYALYNHKHLKLATYKDYDWTKSSEFEILSKHIPTLENTIRFTNLGEKYNKIEDDIQKLPLDKRLLTKSEQNQMIVNYSKLKWVNELNW